MSGAGLRLLRFCPSPAVRTHQCGRSVRSTPVWSASAFPWTCVSHGWTLPARFPFRPFRSASCAASESSFAAAHAHRNIPAKEHSSYPPRSCRWACPHKTFSAAWNDLNFALVFPVFSADPAHPSNPHTIPQPLHFPETPNSGGYIFLPPLQKIGIPPMKKGKHTHHRR